MLGRKVGQDRAGCRRATIGEHLSFLDSGATQKKKK